jgi:putative transposase
MGKEDAIKRAGLHMHPARRSHRFKTAAGKFTTTHYTRVRAHKILELNSKRVLQGLKVHVHKGELGSYDFIFGCDYLSRYGIDLLFSQGVIQWDGMRMSMKNIEDMKENWREEMEQAIEDASFHESRLDDDWQIHYAQQIKDAKYERQDLLKIAKDQKHLSKDQQDQLFNLLSQYKDLFEGTLGEWPDEEVSVELTKDAVPYHCGKPIRIPHIHLETLKKEVQRLVDIGVLEVVDGSKAGPWCAPSFIIPKKDGRVRFITDYRELNKRICRKPWPMPNVADLIQDVGPYTYVTALDLSMGYYHFRLSDELSNLSTFMLPFGMYKYRRLPMGLNISPDLFQEKISKLFGDMPFVRSYLDDLLVFTNGSYEDHLKKLNQVLSRLHSKNLAVNALKTFWAVQEVDYLGFRLTTKGVMPQARKVSSIINMCAPRTRRELRRFIGLVNYYRFMWKRRSHVLAPLAELMSTKTAFKWKPEHQQAFEEMKKIVSRNIMLSFPDYSKPFEIHVDASDKQLGAVLKQGNNTLAFFSKKLNPHQLNYSVGEKEMLSMVEALKEFRTMIYGYPIDVYTDHLNWTHDQLIKNARVMRWRLIIEDYAPTIHYIKGHKNVVADALSRIPFNEDEDEDELLSAMTEMFDMSSWRNFLQPLTVSEIGKAQVKDKYVQSLKSKAPDKLGEFFEDIGKKSGPDRVLTETDSIDRGQRIIVPATLTRRLMEWYHTTLVHPGVNRLYNTLRQHYTWPHMLTQIKNYIKRCKACQLAKRGMRGMGKVPLKDVETEPWKDIAVDCSGPWKAIVNNKEVIFHTLTIIDVFTGWVEIIPIKNKEASYITSLFIQEWLRRYPRPSRVIFDLGGEFDCRSFHTACLVWYIKPEPVTAKNPRANAIVERMHKVLGDMLRVQIVSRYEGEDPIRDLTSAAAYAIRATVHGVNKVTPSQLVFSRDMILRTKMIADVELVRQRRQLAAKQNNEQENKRRIAYRYKAGDKVLILAKSMDPKLKLHEGPYKVLSYDQASGTLHIQRKNYVEPINVRNVLPYFGRS